MEYQLIIHKRAQKLLLGLGRADRNRITEKIMSLKRNPHDLSLDIKRLQGQRGYRLRVGQWRVIFERDDEIRLITIEKIGARGDIYS
ncbi:MAG TPA: type II toxin-antitoxin system RelE/ParE family toxin [Coxiellaceae bacterium]|nr:type II toxin-antitoxin system RelE/ParE family toxin [Coxiellaceae bacterium]